MITETATQEGADTENYLVEKLKNPQTIVSLSLPIISSAIQSNFSEIKIKSEKKGVSVLESARFGLGFLDLASDIKKIVSAITLDQHFSFMPDDMYQVIHSRLNLGFQYQMLGKIKKNQLIRIMIYFRAIHTIQKEKNMMKHKINW